MPTAPTTLRERREAVVREHRGSENRHAFDVTLATFAHPRHELIATGEVFGGKAEVSGYYTASRTAFPDQRNEVHAIHHADDAVIVEFDLLGTHQGPMRCECVYFDSATVLRQLGLVPDPTA